MELCELCLHANQDEKEANKICKEGLIPTLECKFFVASFFINEEQEQPEQY